MLYSFGIPKNVQILGLSETKKKIEKIRIVWTETKNGHYFMKLRKKIKCIYGH